MLPVETVIGRGGLCAVPEGVRLFVRLPWYRALPLSTVEVTALAIDGDPVPLDAIRFEYDGGQWDLDALGEQVDTFWYVLDEASLFVPGLMLEPGSSHQASVTIVLHPPYIPGMQRANSQTEMLDVKQEALQ